MVWRFEWGVGRDLIYVHIRKMLSYKNIIAYFSTKVKGVGVLSQNFFEKISGCDLHKIRNPRPPGWPFPSFLFSKAFPHVISRKSIHHSRKRA